MMFEIFSTPTSTSASASPSASRSSFFGSKNHWDRFQEEWMVLNEWKWRDLLRLQDPTLSKKSYFVNKLIRFDCLLNGYFLTQFGSLLDFNFYSGGKKLRIKTTNLVYFRPARHYNLQSLISPFQDFWLPSCGNLFTFSYIQSKKLNHWIPI